MNGHFPIGASSECGEEQLDSPHALLSHQVELEALLEAGLELDFHSPEYAKFRMEGQEKVDEISPSKCNLDPPSDSDSIFDISGTSARQSTAGVSIDDTRIFRNPCSMRYNIN